MEKNVIFVSLCFAVRRIYIYLLQKTLVKCDIVFITLAFLPQISSLFSNRSVHLKGVKSASMDTFYWQTESSNTEHIYI